MSKKTLLINQERALALQAEQRRQQSAEQNEALKNLQITPIAPQKRTKEEENKDLNYQKNKLVKNLQSIMDAEEITKYLNNNVKDDLNLIRTLNENFSDIQTELKGKKDVSADFFTRFVNRYAKKLNRTGQTGIELPASKEDFEEQNRRNKRSEEKRSAQNERLIEAIEAPQIEKENEYDNYTVEQISEAIDDETAGYISKTAAQPEAPSKKDIWKRLCRELGLDKKVDSPYKKLEDDKNLQKRDYIKILQKIESNPEKWYRHFQLLLEKEDILDKSGLREHLDEDNQDLEGQYEEAFDYDTGKTKFIKKPSKAERKEEAKRLRLEIYEQDQKYAIKSFEYLLEKGENIIKEANELYEQRLKDFFEQIGETQRLVSMNENQLKQNESKRAEFIMLANTYQQELTQAEERNVKGLHTPKDYLKKINRLKRKLIDSETLIKELQEVDIHLQQNLLVLANIIAEYEIVKNKMKEENDELNDHVSKFVETLKQVAENIKKGIVPQNFNYDVRKYNAQLDAFSDRYFKDFIRYEKSDILGREQRRTASFKKSRQVLQPSADSYLSGQNGSSNNTLSSWRSSSSPKSDYWSSINSMHSSQRSSPQSEGGFKNLQGGYNPNEPIINLNLGGEGYGFHHRVKHYRAIRNRHIVGKGILPDNNDEVKYLTIGKLCVHLPSLYKGYLNLKYAKSLGPFPKIPKTEISNQFGELVLKLPKEGLNQAIFNSLSNKEKILFENVARYCDINKQIGFSSFLSDELKEKLKRYNILIGEVEAGQNNPEVFKELKQLIKDLMIHNVLDTKSIKELEELL